MSPDIAIVFVLLIAAFVVMTLGWMSTDIVALTTMAILLGCGILTDEQAFEVFSNPAVVTIGCMFILGAALEGTGALDILGDFGDRQVGRSELSVLAVFLPVVAATSAFVNNTPIILIFIPIITRIARKRNLRSSRLLIPLSFASILGGCCTLIGTSTNLLVSNTAAGTPGNETGLDMFDLAPIGIILTLAGILYLLLAGKRLLPSRESMSEALRSTSRKDFFTELVILRSSPLVGKTLEKTPFHNLTHASIREVIRNRKTLTLPLDEIVFHAGDRLSLSVRHSSVMEIRNLEGIELFEQPESMGMALKETGRAVVVEGVISPQSRLEGNTIRQLDLRRRYGVRILAVHRRGMNMKQDFETTRLQFGDTLLVEGTESSIRHLQSNRSILLLSEDPIPAPLHHKRHIATGAMIGMVLMATFTSIDISVLALMAALAVVITGCLRRNEIYQSIDWRILFMIIGMLSLGKAMAESGGVDLIANWIQEATRGAGPWIVLSMVVLTCSILTTFLSNNAVAVMVTPVVIQLAWDLGVDVKPFLIGVAIGCSACFATPIGYQTNTLVYGAGGYQFRDFLKIGIPLNLLVWILASLFIPLIYSFE